VLLKLGLEVMLFCKNVDDPVIDCMFLCCFKYYVAYRTCKHCRKSFWVIGGSKLGFWMKEGLRVREFLELPDDASLKRASRHLSERPCVLPRIL